MQSFSIVLLALCLSIIGGNDAQKIRLFTGSFFTGEYFVKDISRCSNLYGNAVANIKSVHTAGNCARLYAEQDCAGASVEILARSPSHSSLGTWNFNDRAKSVGPCRDECDKEVTGYEVWEHPPPQEITLFNETSYKGASKNINVHGCTRIPKEFVHNLKSVKIGDALCIQFYGNENCMLDFSGPKTQTDRIELRKGTPSHHDIQSDWCLIEARSVSLCHLKCQTKYQKEITHGFGEVVLFNQTNFTGNSMKLKLEQCVNLTESWDGSVMSIKMSNQTCVALHEGTGCAGDFAKVLDSSPNLSDKNFLKRVKSIEPCRTELIDEDIEAPIVSGANTNSTAVEAENQTTDAAMTFTIGTEEIKQIFLFSQSNFTGNMMDLELEQCVNLTDPWKGSVMSIYVSSNTCVAIYERKGCAGDFTKVLESSPNLSNESFAKRAKSLQPCQADSLDRDNDVSTVFDTNTSATIMEVENRSTDATITFTNHTSVEQTEYPKTNEAISEENWLKRKLQSCPDIFELWDGVKLSVKMLLHQVRLFSKMFEIVQEDSNKTDVVTRELREE